jgi:7-keto-8-aminopelargonate synthetase-like enzyme
MRGDSFARFALAHGPNIPERCAPLLDWANRRLAEGTWSFCRIQEARTGTDGIYRGWNGQRYHGLNFAAQDYLGLAHDPRVIDAAHSAIDAFGLHGAGSEVNGGTTPPADELARRLAEWLRQTHCIIFPTGWAAGYAAIRGLVRKPDHVVIDRLAHNCLREGALASGATITAFDHNNVISLRQELERFRLLDDKAAILVVVESLYSMDSDGPDLKQIVAAARDHAAYVLLDCAHDLGIFGRTGAGLADEAGILDEIDFVVGSFSKVLATTGGFMASRWRQCTLSVQAFGQSNTFSNQLGPIQAATALRALEIVTSKEGDRLRTQVLATAEHFRALLEREGATCIGRPSALIPVLTGNEKVGREATKRLAEDGVLVNFIEYPAVALGASRLRLQISPQHGALGLDAIAARIGKLMRSCRAGHKEPVLLA